MGACASASDRATARGAKNSASKDKAAQCAPDAAGAARKGSRPRVPAARDVTWWPVAEGGASATRVEAMGAAGGGSPRRRNNLTRKPGTSKPAWLTYHPAPPDPLSHPPWCRVHTHRESPSNHTARATGARRRG